MGEQASVSDLDHGHLNEEQLIWVGLILVASHLPDAVIWGSIKSESRVLFFRLGKTVLEVELLCPFWSQCLWG